jgi:SMC interacting uncharacterized protein involved in chromosome segregation
VAVNDLESKVVNVVIDRMQEVVGDFERFMNTIEHLKSKNSVGPDSMESLKSECEKIVYTKLKSVNEWVRALKSNH